MSKNSKNLASATNAAIEAGSTSESELIIGDVPDVAPDHGAADEQRWYEATQRVSKSAADLEKRSDKAIHQMLAMIVLDAELHNAEFYKPEIKAQNISLPQNTDALTLAMVCHMGIDVAHSDKIIKSNNSKALNRYVSAGRQLREEASCNKNGKFDVSFNSQGVARLMDIIVDKGGINALMKLHLKAKKGDTSASLIPLDPENVAELRMQRFAERLSGGNELIVGLGRRESEKSVLVEEEIRLSAAVKNAIASQFSLPHQDVRFLKELLAVGRCVPEIATDILVSRFDDPEDKSAPRRFAHRHYVFDPNGKITVSPILSEASVVVKVEAKVNLLGKPVAGHVEFRTQQVRSVEANLAGDRADVLDLDVESATDTKNGVARIVLSSQAAVKDQYGKSKTVSMLVQQVYSNSGVLPLELDTFTPKYTLDNIDILPAMKDLAGACGDAAKKTKPVKIDGSEGRLSLSVGKAERFIDHSNMPTNFSLNVRADDFSAVSGALTDVNINTGVALGLHPEMLMLSFGTTSASYSVYIPRQGIDGKRSNSLMRKLEPQVWPGLASAEDDNAHEAD